MHHDRKSGERPPKVPKARRPTQIPRVLHEARIPCRLKHASGDPD